MFTLPFGALLLETSTCPGILIGKTSRLSVSIACMILKGSAACAIFICFGSRT